MSTFATVRTNLNTILQTLVTTDAVVTEVIWGRGEAVTGYPYIRYFIAGVDTRHISQQDYLRGWKFTIEIVQEISQKAESTGETDLGNTMDALMNLLEEEWDLSGDILDDAEGTTGEETSGDGKVVVARFLAVPKTFKAY